MTTDRSHPQNSSTPIDPCRWVDEHSDALFQYTMMRVGNRVVAEDLVQETFLGALRAKDRFRGNASVRTWLISILRRKIADHLQHQRRERPVDEPEESAVHFDPRSDRKERLKAWAGDPAQILEEKEFWQVFYDCADKLPEKLSDVFYLREICQISTEEICDLLDITATNLRLRIYRARAHLRQCLERNWFEPRR